MDLELTDDVAFVTAASKGLGKAIANRFVAEGARVAISSRNSSNLEAAKADIIDDQNVSSDRVATVECDLTDDDEIPAAVETVVDTFGGLDRLVANHGGPAVKDFEEATVDDLDRTYRSVLRSMFLVIDSSMPHLLADGGGSIVVTVSASAQEPAPTNVLSNAIRPGLYGLSKSLANQYGDRNVRVNCVCPRGIMTDRIKHKIETRAENRGISTEEALESRTDAVPLDRLGEPEEFAEAVAYVSSDAASFVTGAVLEVDGGWTRYVH